MKIITEHTKNWSARLIQFWMCIDALRNFKKPKFTYNHTWIYLDNFVYEAVDNGVVKVTLEEHYKDHSPTKSKVYEVELSDSDKVKVKEYLESQVGKKYEYANFLWHVIKTITGKWYGSKNDKKSYCYELIFNALNTLDQYKFDPYLNPREAEIFLRKLFSYDLIRGQEDSL